MTEADGLPYREALRTVLSHARPLPAEEVPVAESLGRAPLEAIRSRVDHPPWDASAMDGFAVRSGDVRGARPDAPVLLPVSATIAAGAFPERPLAPGTAARVNTGSPVPEGADGVIRVEHTDGGSGGRVAILRDDDAGRHLRPRGEDVRRDDLLLEAGREITVAGVGSLAMGGHPTVRVARRPRVAVLATGDELAGPDRLAEALEGRRLPDSNSPALAALVREAGGFPVSLGVAPDRPAALRDRLEGAADCDVIVSSGGVSVGEHDHVRDLLAALGGERLFWRTRIRPGSPFLFGLLPDGRLYFGLPGNPVSALVTGEVYLRPALRAMGGHSLLERPRLRARLAEPVELAEGLVHFHRVRLESDGAGTFLARLTGPQGSGILTSLLEADGLMVTGEGTTRLEAGAPVEVIPLRPPGATGG